MRLATLLLISLLCSFPTLAQEANALKGPALEVDADGDGLPEPWGKYLSSGTARTAVDPAEKRSGEGSLRVEIDDGSRCTVTQRVQVPEPGLWCFRVWVKTALAASASVSLYLQWQDAAGKAVLNDRPSRSLRGTQGWVELAALGQRPETSTQALCVIVVEAKGGKGGSVWADDAVFQQGAPAEFLKPQVEADDDPLLMPVRPADGRSVLQNPPDFSWTPQTEASQYEFQLSQTDSFAGAFSTQTPYNVYSHRSVLAAGQWHWRVRFVDKRGQTSDWLVKRSFTVTDQSLPFPVPPPDEMLGRVPTGHPRIYATAQSLAAFRAPLQGPKRDWWASFQRRAEGWLAKPVEQEPPEEWRMGDRPGGGELTEADVQAGNKLRGYTGAINDRMQGLAFAYLLSGERKYADAAVTQMVEVATWDPKGVTSYKNHDQVFRDIAWMMATAYDWCWDVMTAEQRKAVSEAVLVRARVLYADFSGRARPIYAAPYDSHGITSYGYLGICAIALAGEYPEADAWFRFVAATYPAVFPPWGGEEGGWSQGVGYWKWSQGFAWWFFDALKSATGVDMYQKAFCRNTGLYKLYMHPPWCDRHHFGDGNHGAPDNWDQTNMARMATVYRNPVYQWYAQSLPGKPDMGIYGYWWFDPTLPARPPADLPQGKLFPDIGWVAMHSDLSDPNDVMLLFKSSPFGSFNHSHADQNSFVVYGYGEPLLIDSGYYDWYGSPHDMGFTRQTKAHNCVLVNGEGQSIMDKRATGEVVEHFTSPPVDYAVGEAAGAYAGQLKRFTRRIIYLRPNAFLVVDDLEAPEPSLFTWALHAENEMKLKPDQQEVMVSRGEARCLVKFITPQDLKFEQTDQFTPPSTRKLANEWHTYVSTTQKATKARFVTFIRPCPASEPESDLEVRTQLQNDLLLLVWGTEATPGGVVAGWLGDEPAFTVVGPWGKGAVASVLGAKSVDLKDQQGEFRLLSSPVALLATLELTGKDNATAEVRRATYRLSEPATVDLRVRTAVKTLLMDGKPLPGGAWHWAEEKLTLELPAGDHVLEVNPTPPAAEGTLNLQLDGQAVALDLQSMPTNAGGRLSWGAFTGEPQLVRAEKLAGSEAAQLTIGTQSVREGQVLWLAEQNAVTARSGPGEALTVSLQPVISNLEPLPAQVMAQASEQQAGVVKLEAESFTHSGNGTPSRYTNRPFLSAGTGLGNWSVPGMWVQWTLQVAKAGKYALILKAATHEPQADRLLELDGKPVGGEYRLTRFPHTQGYGATPEEWQLLQAPQPLELTAGAHVLKMTNLGGLLNCDYLLLVPVP